MTLVSTKRILARAGLALFASAAMAACGGGGAGDSGQNPPDPILGGGPPAGNPPDGGPAVTTDSWTMVGSTGSFGYANGGHSAANSGHGTTVAVFSTASMGGGTDQGGNGVYSGSSLTVSLRSAGSGLYTVVPTMEAFVAAADGAQVLLANVVVGTGVATGAERYDAQAGQVAVLFTTDGQITFKTDKALPMTRTLSVNGGIAGAPDTMALTVNEVRHP